MKFLSVYKTAETGKVPTAEEMGRMGALVEDGFKSGYLLATEGCLPSALGARIRIASGAVTVTDGPFTESKEVIGGYAVIAATTRDEAIRSTREFMQLHADHWPEWEGECELRELVFLAP